MRKSVTISIFILLLVSITFLPRVLSLSEHWASDETLWMLRSRKFFFALQNKHTSAEAISVSHHPGITTCWLGSLAIWEKSRRGNFSQSWLPLLKPFLSPNTLARIRFPIAVMTGILVLGAGILLYRLFDGITAGLGTLFLAVEPFLLSESRRVHTDALMSLFLFLALLLWIYYLESETQHRRSLILSGIFFALACLTKSLAGAFLLFLPLLLVWYIKKRGMYWVKIVWSFILWIMSFQLTVILVWPLFWFVQLTLWKLPLFPLLFVGCSAILIWSYRKLSIDIPSMFTRTELLILGYGLFVTMGTLLSSISPVISNLYWALTEANRIPTLFLGEIRYNPGTLYFPVMWFVWSTPLTFPLIGFAVYHAWQQRYHEKKIYRIVVVLGTFTLFYLIGLSLVDKKISRYIVIFLPAVSLLTTLGAVQIAQLLKKKQLQVIFLIAVILLQLVPVLRLHPYYRTYYYPLLSGKWVSENTSSITGAGLDLAADYLNALPNVQHLKIRVRSFSEDLEHYLVAETVPAWDPNHDNIGNFDYDVEHLYDKQIQGTPVDPSPIEIIRTSKKQPSVEYTRELEHVVRLNGIDYVWIYRILSYDLFIYSHACLQ